MKFLKNCLVYMTIAKKRITGKIGFIAKILLTFCGLRNTCYILNRLKKFFGR